MVTKTFEFDDTSIPMQYSMNMKDDYNIMWIDTRTANLYRTMFAAIADTLKHNQSKENERIGFMMIDDKGNFKFGATLNFVKPEDSSEEDKGNWYLEMTFNKEDMDGVNVILDNHSDVFIRCAAMEAQNISSGRFNSTDIMHTMFNVAIDTLVQFLDTNVSETDEVEVSLRSVFTASAVVEDGKKYFSIVPGEYIKQIIKGDATL